MIRTLPIPFALMLLLTACGAPEGQIEVTEPVPTSAPQSKQEAAEHRQSGKSDLPFDLCERWGWYEDEECDWFCSKRDPVCHAAPLGPEPEGQATRLPLVLTHGFNAGREGMWSFYKIEEALVRDGHTVYLAEVPAFASAETRAASLASQVDEVLQDTGARRVHVIAHSMGGLDARHMISGLGYGDRVASLTTISSPHRGSAVADVALRLTPGKADRVINTLATLWSRTFNEIDQGADVRDALTSLSTQRMVAFNQENPDDERVHYQSWAGVSSVLGLTNRKDEQACDGKFLWHDGQADVMNKMLVPMAAILAPGTSLTPNDGMATVESAKWGEFHGCIPADHLDEVGQIQREGADTHTGFDHVRFYRNLAYDLAARDL